MKFLRNGSVASRVIIATTTALTLVLLLVGLITFQLYSSHLDENAKSDLEASTGKLLAGVTLAVWNIDSEQIWKVLEASMIDRDLYGVRIESEGREYALVRGKDWEPLRHQQYDVSGKDLMTLEKSIDQQGYTVGRLTVHMSKKFLKQSKNEAMMIIAAAIILIDGVLSIVLYWTLWPIVLKPLKNIGRYTEAVSRGEAGADISRGLSGELQSIYVTLKRTLNQLDERMNETKKINEQFWTLIRELPIPIGMISSITGQMIFLNRAFEETLGYRLADVPDGETWFEKAYPDAVYRQQVIETWTSALEKAAQEDQRVRALEYAVTCKNGKVKDVEISGILAGEFTVGVLVDVTEKKAAEEAVQAYQSHLEELVDQRTEELVHARDVAESANQAKSVFLANMSHELRTPLNSVIGFSRLMTEEQSLSENQQRNLNIINRSGKHLLSLINDILEISKIESGKIELNDSDVCLRKLIDDVMDMLRPRALQKGLMLETQFGELPDTVGVDEAKLRQVLINLLVNAIKFTHKGKVMLTVSCENLEGEAAKFKFEVMDTGVGIAEEDQERIFEPFIQIKGDQQNVGTGLGLAICKQYLAMLGSEFQIKSERGKGSTFSFELRLRIVKGVEANSAPITLPKVLASGELSKYPVLIVDDVLEIRILLKELLKKFGFKIIEAKDGLEALEKIKKSRPQLVFMDWKMPGMDGLEVTRKVRKMTDITQPDIVMLSANAFREDKEKASAAGVTDFLAKPVEVEELYLTVERYMGVSGLSDSEPLQKNVMETKALCAEDIESLSNAARANFKEALIELNPSKIQSAIDIIRKEDEGLADSIKRYSDSMQYRPLWKLFGVIEN